LNSITIRIPTENSNAPTILFVQSKYITAPRAIATPAIIDLVILFNIITPPYVKKIELLYHKKYNC
jgi:hypothetical protein